VPPGPTILFFTPTHPRTSAAVLALTLTLTLTLTLAVPFDTWPGWRIQWQSSVVVNTAPLLLRGGGGEGGGGATAGREPKQPKSHKSAGRTAVFPRILVPLQLLLVFTVTPRGAADATAASQKYQEQNKCNAHVFHPSMCDVLQFEAMLVKGTTEIALNKRKSYTRLDAPCH
jgi:hypothetical protein